MRFVIVGMAVESAERHLDRADAVFDQTARAFWAHSGFKNQVGLLKLALTRAGVKGLVIPKPEPSLDFVMRLRRSDEQLAALTAYSLWPPTSALPRAFRR